MIKKIISLTAALACLMTSAAALESSMITDYSALPVSAEVEGKWEYTVRTNGTAVIDKYNGSDKSVSVPSAIGGKKVTELGSSCFSKCKAETVTIPNTVTKIGYWAFGDCTALRSIVIPNSVTEISDWAFSGCSALKSITLPKSLSKIPSGFAIGCTALEQITIPEGVKMIGDVALLNCSKLRTVNISSTVSLIGEDVFAGCRSLDSISTAAANKYYSSVGGALFNKDRTTLVKCPATKASFSIPATVRTIMSGAFECCSKLTALNIPASVSKIELHAILDCNKLTKITVADANKNYAAYDGMIYNKSLKTLIVCPAGKTSISFAPTTQKISDSAFYLCSKISYVEIPKTVTSLGENSFSNCRSLTTAVIPSSVETISTDAFSNCENLKTVTICEGVKKIETSAFSDCKKLTSVYIPKSVGYIENKSVWTASFGYMTDASSSDIRKVSGFKFYCTEGSAAETYAKQNGFDYEYAADYMRISGSNRFATAASISKADFTKSKTVVLAYGYDYADALAGVPLANAYNAPILLTDKNKMVDVTLDEIKRLKAESVVILGGSSAIGSEVVKSLESIGIAADNIRRIHGKTRFDTAVQIAAELEAVTEKKPDKVFFVSSSSFADALSVSSIAALSGSPVLYVSKNEVNDATSKYLETIKDGLSEAFVIGGTGVITDQVKDRLSELTGKEIRRISGSNRYETSAKINSEFSALLTGKTILAVTGKTFPDALAGGVLAARKASPLLLAENYLSDSQTELFRSRELDKLTVLGGSSAVTDRVIQQICMIKSHKPKS